MGIALRLLMLGFSLVAAHCGAQSYPLKPVRMVAPAPQGGGIDLLARAFGERMGQSMGQPVIVENRQGAGGAIGIENVARSAPDGH